MPLDEFILLHAGKSKLEEVTHRQAGLNSAHVRASVKALKYTEKLKDGKMSDEEHLKGRDLHKTAEKHATKVGEHDLAKIHGALAAHHEKEAGISKLPEKDKDESPKTTDGATKNTPRITHDEAVKHINSIKAKKDPKEHVEFTADTKEKQGRPYKMHFHVESGIKGQGMGYKPEEHGLIHGHDATVKNKDGTTGGYRAVKTSNLRTIKINGVDHDVVHHNKESVSHTEEETPVDVIIESTDHAKKILNKYLKAGKYHLAMKATQSAEDNESEETNTKHYGKDSANVSKDLRKKKANFHTAASEEHGKSADAIEKNSSLRKSIGGAAGGIKSAHRFMQKYHSDSATRLKGIGNKEKKNTKESQQRVADLNEELSLKLVAAQSIFESLEESDSLHTDSVEEKMHQSEDFKSANKTTPYKGMSDKTPAQHVSDFEKEDIPEEKPKFKGSKSHEASETAFHASSEIADTKNHAHAADLHKQAAELSRKAGLHGLAKHHEGIADVHRKLAAETKTSGAEAHAKHAASGGKNARREIAKAKGVGKDLIKKPTNTDRINTATAGIKSATNKMKQGSQETNKLTANNSADKKKGFDMAGHKARAIGLAKAIGAHISGIISNPKKKAAATTEQILVAPVTVSEEKFWKSFGKKINEGIDGKQAWSESVSQISEAKSAYTKAHDRANALTKKAMHSHDEGDHMEAATAHEKAMNLTKHSESKNYHQKKLAYHAKAGGGEPSHESLIRSAELLSEFATDVNTKEAHLAAFRACSLVEDRVTGRKHLLASREAEDVDTLKAAEDLAEASVNSTAFSLLTKPKKFATYHEGLGGEVEKLNAVSPEKYKVTGKKKFNMKECLGEQHLVINESNDATEFSEEPLRMEMGNKENGGKNSNPVPSKTSYSHNYGVAHFASLRANRTKKPDDHKYAIAQHTHAMNSAKDEKDSQYHQHEIGKHTDALKNTMLNGASRASGELTARLPNESNKSGGNLKEVYTGPASPQKRIASSKAGKAAAMKKYTVKPVSVKPTIAAKPSN